MPRSKVPLQSQFPYHIGARCINRDWFSLPMDTVWNIMSEHLHFVSHAFHLDILAFLLMHNHFHLIARTPQENLDKAMAWFMRESSRSLTREGNRINQSYCGRYFRSVLGSNHYFLHAYKYLYANPLRAGLAQRAEDYKYSTLPGLLGSEKLLIPVKDDLTLFSDIEGTLNWINWPAREEHLKAVRLALRQRKFRLAEQNRKPHFLESEML